MTARTKTTASKSVPPRSPRTFKVKGQYEKNLGNEVEVLTRDGRKLKGVRTAVGDDDFTVEVTRKVKEPGAKRPVMVAEPQVIPYAEAKQVCYVINFK